MRRLPVLLIPVSLGSILVALLAGMLVAGPLGGGPARAAEPALATAEPALPDSSVVGIHNGYDKGRFAYLLDALESGAGMVELDIWQNFLGSRRYIVGHDAYPNNNCETATRYEQLRRQWRNQPLQSCLNNIRLWHQRWPEHPPLILKLEMKNGFDDRHGFGPDEFDRLLVAHLGADVVFSPADLLAGRHPDLDTASRAGAWPSRSALRGQVVVLVQRGTFEAGNPLDKYHTELEYADHLAALSRAGRLAAAAMFPTLLGKVQAQDPRTGVHGGNRKPWYVSFDAGATTWLGGDTSFYVGGHYLVTMTEAHAVPPPIDARRPPVDAAAERLRLLAGHGASVVSSDWTAPEVLGLTATRG